MKILYNCVHYNRIVIIVFCDFFVTWFPLINVVSLSPSFQTQPKSVYTNLFIFLCCNSTTYLLNAFCLFLIF